MDNGGEEAVQPIKNEAVNMNILQCELVAFTVKQSLVLFKN
jgi:hypothetical protein